VFIVSLVPHSTSTSLLIPLFYSSSFDTNHSHLYIFLCLLLFLATNSIVFHLPPCTAASILWCNQIISTLNFSFFRTYTFSFFNTKSPSTCYSFPFNNLTSTFFISSTTLTTSSFFSLVNFIFFNIFTLGSSITTLAKL